MPQAYLAVQSEVAKEFVQSMVAYTLAHKHKGKAEITEKYLFDELDKVALTNIQDYCYILTENYFRVELLLRYFQEFPVRLHKYFANCTAEQFLLNIERICQYLRFLNYKFTYLDSVPTEKEVQSNYAKFNMLIDQVGLELDTREFDVNSKNKILTCLISCLIRSNINRRSHKSFQDQKILLFLNMLTDVNIPDESGDTLLHVIMREEQTFPAAIDILEQKGANYAVVNVAGETPVTIGIIRRPEFIQQRVKIQNLDPVQLNLALITAILCAKEQLTLALTAKLKTVDTWDKIQTAKNIFKREPIQSMAVYTFVLFAKEAKLDITKMLQEFSLDKDPQLVYRTINCLLHAKSYWVNIEYKAHKQIWYFLAGNAQLAAQFLRNNALLTAYFINDISLHPLAKYFSKVDKDNCPLALATANANVAWIYLVITLCTSLDYRNPLIIELQNSLQTLRRNNVNIDPIIKYLESIVANQWRPSRWYSVQYNLLQAAIAPLSDVEILTVKPQTTVKSYFWHCCTKDQEPDAENQNLADTIRRPLLESTQVADSSAYNDSNRPLIW